MFERLRGISVGIEAILSGPRLETVSHLSTYDLAASGSASIAEPRILSTAA
jgi:hypothetical protein